MADYIKNEILRKLIHISSIWIIFLYCYVNKIEMLLILGAVAFIYIGSDLLRIKSKIFKKIFMPFNFIMRDFEIRQKKLTGASYFLLSSFMVTLLFTKIIALLAIAVLITADSAAAIFGRIYGKKNFFCKSLEGSAAFFITGTFAGFFIIYYLNAEPSYYLMHIIAMIVATIAEALSPKIKIDDNFSVPFAIALSFYVMSLVL